MFAIIFLLLGLVAGGTMFGVIGALVLAAGGFWGGAMLDRRRKAHRPANAPFAPPPMPVYGVAPAAPAYAGDPVIMRIYALEQRVQALEQALRAGAAAESPIAPADTVERARTKPDSAAPPPEPAVQRPGPVMAAAAPAMAIADVAPTSASVPPPPAYGTAAPNPLWAWITGGNTLARVGVVLLFIGVAFLLKYAAEHVDVPIELRLAGVALGAVAMLVVGWRLRTSRTAYAMVVQGGGIGVLYLTVFAALKLYSLLPPMAAFVLLLWIAAFSAFLAVKQDSLALAILAVSGGFLAPILTSTGAGDHVLLFGYYAILNAGIFAIAWFKAWRSLNLLGFAFTFVIGTFWGVTRYEPRQFATTEPFLVLFFLFYVGIAILYALRRSVAVRSYVDGALVFGTPLVAAGLQSALVRDLPYGMAYSALAMATVYLGAAKLLYSREGEGLRQLVEAFIALGLIFATLAIPLALDARWTTATWALEGAAMVWVGVRQRRVALRAFGLLLQFGAGFAFGAGLTFWLPDAAPGTVPVLNSACIGALLVALAGLASAWFVQRERDDLPANAVAMAWVAFVWGCGWWLFAGWREIERFVSLQEQVPAMIVFLTVSAALFAFAERGFTWPAARIPALALLPLLLVLALAAVQRGVTGDTHAFAHGGVVAWLLAVAVLVLLLRRFEPADGDPPGRIDAPLDLWHAGLSVLVLLLVAHEAAWAAREWVSARGAWPLVPWGLVPALGLFMVAGCTRGDGWPFGVRREGYLVMAGTAIAVFLALWSFATNVSSDGDPAPLPYVPLLNPLDLTLAAAFIAAVLWARRLDAERPGWPRPQAVAILAALAFVWVNAIVLRSLHFYADIPYHPDALWRSMLVQAALSLLWSLLALATMVVAARRGGRTLWMAGAVLLGVVVAKLFLVELSHVGGLPRIVSFLGVGALALLIGYLAPVPPRRPEEAR